MRQKRLTARIGLRGVILLHFGIPWIAIGVAYLQSPVVDRFSRNGPGASLEVMDSNLWGILWIVSGLVAIVAALTRVRTKQDHVGFGSLVVPAALWSTSYAVSWLEWILSNGELGRQTSLPGALAFGIFTSLILYLAKIKDPDDPTIQGATP
jgi:hypothetical protein